VRLVIKVEVLSFSGGCSLRLSGVDRGICFFLSIGSSFDVSLVLSSGEVQFLSGGLALLGTKNVDGKRVGDRVTVSGGAWLLKSPLNVFSLSSVCEGTTMV